EHLLEPYQLELVERLGSAEGPQVDGPALGRILQYRALECERRFSRARALGSRKVLPLPHQIDAVYNRMLQAPQVRFLLADDPGAGKTIMAGMLIREMQARASAERVLILVPPLVLTQWQDELKSKFDLEFRIITRATLKEAAGRNPFVEIPYCLTSMYFAARDDVKALVAEADFDLVIIDEAHKMAAYTEGVKKRKIRRTRLYQLGEVVCRRAPHRLLLTATPHKGDTENYRHLLQLVDSDVFSRRDKEDGDPAILRDRANPYVIRRLKENMVRFDGTPLFPPRTTITLEFDLSDEELHLYEAVTDYVRTHFNRAMGRGQTRTAFAMMVLQRRLSSSVEAIRQSLSRRRKRLEELLTRIEMDRGTDEAASQAKAREWDIQDEMDEVPLSEQEHLEEQVESETDAADPEELRAEIEELGRLISRSEAVLRSGHERKIAELERTLFGPEGLLAKGEKILIFTEFTDTVRYLQERLQGRVAGIAT
ncbi:MAG: DEAD/DEAH box helicase family protein, partial [Alicyclobacillaceae bacterium]|nr:DEAD/DEAH box helicase family protein [Alicyclobacillaceae bacterium]